MSGHFFLQKILTDFVNIEMVYHAKALEVYTECFQNIRSFDVEEDIEVFYIVKFCVICMIIMMIVMSETKILLLLTECYIR